MKIKICGLFRPEDIEAVNEALPDYIGFVFAKSPRQVTREQAKEMKQRLNPKIQAIGVFVDAPLEEVVDLVEEGTIQLVQLHGNESQEYMDRLKEKTQCEIIKAIRVDTEEDVLAAQEVQADYLLFDQGAGGTGKTFSWGLVKDCKRQFFMAGGINSANVSAAMAAGMPYVMDISSGVETNGVKDREKIVEIVRRVHNG